MGRVFDRYSLVMLGLDPSIQGDRSLACPWTLATSARVTAGEGTQMPMDPGVKPRDDSGVGMTVGVLVRGNAA